VVKPRSNVATSIPGLLSIFHNEWDALMLETATLRESLESRNRELATALYHYDAAVRCIARLTAERDEARAGLAAAPGRRAEEAAEEVAPKKAKPGVPAAALELIAATAETLSKGRKKRVQSAELAPAEAVGRLAPAAAPPLHKSSAPGILALSAHPRRPELLASAGADKSVVLFDRAGGRRLGELKAHSKEVTSVAFAMAGDALLTGSADKTVRLWTATGEGEGGYRAGPTLAPHAAAVTAVSVHPCGSLAASFAADGSWALLDLPSATVLQAVAGGAACAAGAFHPDGMIVGTAGGDSVVRVWDVKSGAAAAAIEGHSGGVSALSFSENGYYLASGGGDGVRVWDLRKLKCLTSLLPGGASAVAFDASGFYLAAGGAEGLSVFSARAGADWAQLAALPPPKGGAACLLWGRDAGWLAAGGAQDHSLHIFAPAEAAAA